MIKYHQDSSNSCCLCSLASYFRIIYEKRSVTALSNHIEESLTFQSNRFRNRIDFVNDITKKKLRQTGEQHLRYNINNWKKKGSFDILNDIHENVTLVQLMDTLGNVNCAISILGNWIL